MAWYLQEESKGKRSASNIYVRSKFLHDIPLQFRNDANRE